MLLSHFGTSSIVMRPSASRGGNQIGTRVSSGSSKIGLGSPLVKIVERRARRKLWVRMLKTMMKELVSEGSSLLTALLLIGH